MNAIVIKHVPVTELPVAWREQLAQAPNAHVTVHIEAEPPASDLGASGQDNPLFGMWRDREDMADVAAYVRNIRAPRFNRSGSGDES